MDVSRNRVEIYAKGQWTLADADAFHRDILRVRQWSDAHPHVDLAILADCDGLILHTAPVAARVERSVDQIKRIRIGRYALVVPSYLMRMQCRRLLDGIEHRIFDDRAEAEEWLGGRRLPVAA